MPLAVFFDSMSGAGDREMIETHNNPKRFQTKGGDENKFAGYWHLGMVAKQIEILCRDHLGIDAMILATTTPRKPGVVPQLCIDGNMVPENFTRLTNYTMYLEPRTRRFGPYETKEAALAAVTPASHRSFGAVQNEDGKWLAVVTDRYFTTVSTGEVEAKASSALELEEKADLPTILRKLHGRGGAQK